VQTDPGGYDYERGRALMTAEVNAVIKGVLAADAWAAVLVADAHSSFRNLLRARRYGAGGARPDRAGPATESIQRSVLAH
jgi:hypothetical protein